MKIRSVMALVLLTTVLDFFGGADARAAENQLVNRPLTKFRDRFNVRPSERWWASFRINRCARG